MDRRRRGGTENCGLRGANYSYNATVKDPGFIAEAKKRNMILNPARGEFIQKVVYRTVNAPKAIVAKTKAILGFK